MHKRRNRHRLVIGQRGKGLRRLKRPVPIAQQDAQIARLRAVGSNRQIGNAVSIEVGRNNRQRLRLGRGILRIHPGERRSPRPQRRGRQHRASVRGIAKLHLTRRRNIDRLTIHRSFQRVVPDAPALGNGRLRHPIHEQWLGSRTACRGAHRPHELRLGAVRPGARNELQRRLSSAAQLRRAQQMNVRTTLRRRIAEIHLAQRHRFAARLHRRRQSHCGAGVHRRNAQTIRRHRQSRGRRRMSRHCQLHSHPEQKKRPQFPASNPLSIPALRIPDPSTLQLRRHSFSSFSVNVLKSDRARDSAT